MKASELIALLQNLDPDTEIAVHDWGHQAQDNHTIVRRLERLELLSGTDVPDLPGMVALGPGAPIAVIS